MYPNQGGYIPGAQNWSIISKSINIIYYTNKGEKSLRSYYANNFWRGSNGKKTLICGDWTTRTSKHQTISINHRNQRSYHQCLVNHPASFSSPSTFLLGSVKTGVFLPHLPVGFEHLTVLLISNYLFALSRRVPMSRTPRPRPGSFKWEGN